VQTSGAVKLVEIAERLAWRNDLLLPADKVALASVPAVSAVSTAVARVTRVRRCGLLGRLGTVTATAFYGSAGHNRRRGGMGGDGTMRGDVQCRHVKVSSTHGSRGPSPHSPAKAHAAFAACTSSGAARQSCNR